MPKDSRASTIGRLARIEHLLYQSGAQGMTLDKLADACDVSQRSIQRDLKLIELENIFPLWRDEKTGSCGIVLKRYLPPIRFDTAQALNIFLAARLMTSYAHRNDPGIADIFTKLNCIMQPPLKEQIEKTIAWMKTLPQKDKTVRHLTRIAEAWVTERKVKIVYQSAKASQPEERLICPYFIQPAGEGHSSYIIAHCHKSDAIRIFKVERIISAFITDEKYTVPHDFDANDYLSSAWGIIVGDEIKTIKLRVAKNQVRFMEEIFWHTSQELVQQADGSALMTVKVSHTSELMNWIMGWGGAVEVLEPPSLRQEIAHKAETIVKLYAGKKNAGQPLQ